MVHFLPSHQGALKIHDKNAKQPSDTSTKLTGLVARAPQACFRSCLYLQCTLSNLKWTWIHSEGKQVQLGFVYVLNQSYYHTIVGTSLAQHNYLSLLSSAIPADSTSCSHATEPLHPVICRSQVNESLKLLYPLTYSFLLFHSPCPCNLDRILCNCRRTRGKTLVFPSPRLAPKLYPSFFFHSPPISSIV